MNKRKYTKPKRTIQHPVDKLEEVLDVLALYRRVQFRKRTAAQHRKINSLVAYRERLERRIETGEWS